MVTALMFGFASSEQAHALTGGEVLNKLDTDQQVQHLSGVLAGLGYARFLRDRPDEDGYKCIEGWLGRKTTERWDIMKQWLEQHKEKPVAVILYTAVSKDCGQ
jgi:hypothetical protein